MTKHHLSFGEINFVEQQICELLIHPGIEVDSNMVNEYHDFLDQHKENTSTILINNINDYTYTFDAQKLLLDLPHIRAIAFLIYRESTRLIIELLARTHRKHHWNMQIFTSRDEAISWLRDQLPGSSH